MLKTEAAPGGVLADIVTPHLLAHAPLILRCSDSIPDRHTEVAPADDSRVLRVHSSLSADRLGGLLDRAVDKRRR
jgi:hypothetical protein